MTPIYQTSTYKQDGVGKNRGFEYSRTGNPTRTALEARLATLEAGKYGLTFASGMAAIDAILRLLEPGDHVLAGNDVYGGTFRLFDKEFHRYGLDFTYINTTDIQKVEAGLQPNTRMVWLETPSNPLLNVSDIGAIAEVVHTHDPQTMLVVDNTFTTPYLQRPLDLRADLVVHSTTKYLGGHSDVVGGAIVTRDDSIHERKEQSLPNRSLSALTILSSPNRSGGGVESLIEVPATMTHLSTTGSPLAVDPGLVRLSVGLEHIEDLLADLENALSHSSNRTVASS